MERKSFNKKLREIRMKKKLGLRQMAKQVGISAAYLSRIESGRELPPKAHHIVRMAEVLEIPPDDLLRLAQKIDPKIEEYIFQNPLIPDFLRTAKKHNLSDERLRELISTLKRKS